jgi:hypothetical protein
MSYDPTRGLQQMVQDQYTPTIQPVTGFQAPTIETTQAPQFRSLLSADIGAYQSPYQQQVIDTAMQDIQRQADIARGGAQERAIRAGAFGGSRSALLEAESQRPFVEQMARTSANLRQAGFEQAQRAAQSDIARQQELGVFGAGQQQQRALQQAQLQQQRQLAGLDIAGRAALSQPQLEMQARAQRAGLLGGLQGQQLQQLGLLGQAGAQQQMLQQRAIDASRGEFQRALGYPQQQFGLFSAGTGQPLIGGTSSVQRDTGGGDILGTAAQLYGMYLLSDERLKENIEPIGISENGHNVYTWDWNDKAKELGVNDPTTGVIAQEVMKYMPEAVIKDANGYYKVNYGVL